MSTPPDGGPAFPKPAERIEDSASGIFLQRNDGMSLRDWFAGHAPQEELHVYGGEMREGETVVQYFSRARYAYADAMLEARKAKQ